MKLPPFFPRGNGPLVSVLIPTRGRPDNLRKTVESCVQLASNKDCLEFLFKLDEDDVASLEVVESLTEINQKKVVSPRGRGYADLHYYQHELAAISTGDWLFFLNDDLVLETPEWDQVVAEGIPNAVVPGIQDITMFIPSMDCGFPILRRKVYDLLGHVSLDTCYDTWIWAVMNLVGPVPNAPIKLRHYGIDDGISTSYKPSWNKFATSRAKSIRERMKDVDIIASYLEEKERNAEWLDNPNLVGWYICRTKDGESNFVYVNENREIIGREEVGNLDFVKWYLVN